MTQPDVRETPNPAEGQFAIDQIGRLCQYRAGVWHLMENIRQD